jgi:hypothetical protein
VAPRVVHGLEAVQIDDHQREGFAAAARPCERLLDPVLEELPVREAGQRVTQGRPLGRAHAVRQEPRAQGGHRGHRERDGDRREDPSLTAELEARQSP